MKTVLNILFLSMWLATQSASAQSDSFVIEGNDGSKIKASPLAVFDSAWAMTFLPDARALVSEKSGDIWLLSKRGEKIAKVSQSPNVTPRGQGGMGDIILADDFTSSGRVYLSYVERDVKDDSLSGAVVERAKLTLSQDSASLSDRTVVWTQSPKVTGNGHYSHRLAISPDGYLFITSGDRQKFNPAQNMAMNLGKVIRLNLDGSIPSDNPFVGSGGVASEVWSLGHRNPLGIAFDQQGNLWTHEMGPRHGDELNRIMRATNYGYPFVSEGEHYNGTTIPSHASMPIFQAPDLAWVPAISPAGLIIYQGEQFADWQGHAFIGGLSSQALIRVDLGENAQGADKKPKEAARYEWGKRVREIEQGPEGAIYVLEDATGGRLLKLEAMKQ
ncbi:MAG: PQQ-dependent sugar dehydrogenase [Paraglaciecola sp.]|nr:PQQ-dependent sugar dehydrogenase [Paraglaciecola sp.]